MMLPIKPETLMWLLPVVFMIHDFEEIIMMRPWLIKNWAKLEKRFPAKYMILALKIARKFDIWLRKNYSVSE